MDKPVNTHLLRAIVLLLAFKCLAAISYHAAVLPGAHAVGDYPIYRMAAQRLDKHEALYIHETGPTLLNQHVSSPLIPILVRPLDRLPADKALAVWVAMNIGLMLLAVVLYCWGTGVGFLDDVAPVLLALFTAFRFWPTVLEFVMGNSDVILLLAVCGMFVCARYGKWILFALLVALAALTKTWMIGALFYLLARRKWLAAAASLGFFLGGGAILFCMIGWREFPVYLAVTKRYASQPLLISHSVAGIARLFFSANPVMTPWTLNPVIHLAALAAGYGILVAGLFYLWWKGPQMNEYQARLCLGLTALALILGSPVSHQYYCIMALPLLWTLLIGSGESTPGWGVRAAALLLYLVYSVPTPGDPLTDAYRHGIKSAEVALTFLTGMSLWGLGLFALKREFPAVRQIATGT